MKNHFTFFLISVILISACKKEQVSEIKPKIILNSTEGYVFADETLSAGEQFLVEINATSESGENLSNIIIKSNGISIIDEGINTSNLTKEITLTKSLEETEVLTFIIRNKALLADSITIILTKSGNQFSEIERFSSVNLGCHANTTLGNYFSFEKGLIYTQSEAVNNQDLIDIIYFYDAVEDGNALGSPGANLSTILTGIDAPENWVTKRTTRFSRESIIIPDHEFTNAENDSLILANFLTDGGRKAKLLTAGQYFSFQNSDNKYGIIKIENVIVVEEGSLQFSVIIQK